MQIDIFDFKITKLLDSLGGGVFRYVLPAAVAIVVLWIAWRLLLHRRRRVSLAPAPDLKIDIASLGDDGPPPGPPTLEFYNLPVRLAAVVLAPAGRMRDLPPIDQLPPLVEAIVPGLDKLLELHRPLVRRWANQVSVRGFAHLFFNSVRLPGNAGRDTPWSSAAGVFKFQGQPVMVGLVLRAAAPNSLGQTIINTEHEWLGCLRVRWN